MTVSIYRPFDDWAPGCVLVSGVPVGTLISEAIIGDVSVSAIIVPTQHDGYPWAYDVAVQEQVGTGEIHLGGGLAQSQAEAMASAARIARCIIHSPRNNNVFFDLADGVPESDLDAYGANGDQGRYLDDCRYVTSFARAVLADESAI